MKKNYETPELLLANLSAADVITTSVLYNDENGDLPVVNLGF